MEEMGIPKEVGADTDAADISGDFAARARVRRGMRIAPAPRPRIVPRPRFIPRVSQPTYTRVAAVQANRIHNQRIANQQRQQQQVSQRIANQQQQREQTNRQIANQQQQRKQENQRVDKQQRQREQTNRQIVNQQLQRGRYTKVHSGSQQVHTVIPIRNQQNLGQEILQVVHQRIESSQGQERERHIKLANELNRQ